MVNFVLEWMPTNI